MKISIHKILYEQISLSTDYWLVQSRIIYIKNVVNIMYKYVKKMGQYIYAQIIVK